MANLPPIPQQLPKTQADWDRIVNALQNWQQIIQAPTWHAPTLLNGWVYYGTPYNPPGYLMDADGRVHLRGMFNGISSGGSGSTAFVLPWKPQHTQLFSSICMIGSTEQAARVDIDASGNVIMNIGVGGTISWLTLDGLSFSLSP